MIDDDDDIERIETDLGPCCVCATRVGVTNILMLDRRGAVPGQGWGCFVCNLPMDGAYAVLCDDCLQRCQADAAVLKFACLGYPGAGARISIDDLPEGVFAHNDAAHEADMAGAAEGNDGDG